MLRIAIAQINTTVGDLKGNLTKMEDSLASARRRQADCVVFPECTIPGYPPEDLVYKDHFVQDNLKILRALTKKISGITAVAGFVDMDTDKRIYNAAAVIADKKIRGVIHKQALPNYGVFDEKRYFQKGENPLLFELAGSVLGVNICEDIWREGGVHLQQARSGAQVLLNLSASPYDFGKLKERERLLKRRAKELGVYVCYANLVGGQDELVFDGGSLVIDPKGRVMAAGPAFQEALIVTDLPTGKRKAGRKSAKHIVLPAHPRSDEKSPLDSYTAKKLSVTDRIIGALVLGTRDYVRKNGFKKVVVGLSGGIDSSLVAVIACKAVGKENVVGVSMPSAFTSEGTRSDARTLAENLEMDFREIPIGEVFESYLRLLEKEFSGLASGVAEENIQARIRGNLLMALSNKFGWLVLTTGNKSEVAVGYCTLYGDMTGGFAVIKDVPKTLVYRLADHINQQETRKLIPQSVIDRAPSAELRPGQKDRDSLPDYDILDPILQAYVEEHRSLSAIARLHPDKTLLKEVVKKVDRSEYKRRQSPPGIKITSRAFGKDWRLPITNKYREFE